MRFITQTHMHALVEQLQKEAAFPLSSIRRLIPAVREGLARHVGTYGGKLAVGAGAGALVGAGTAEPGDRLRGASKGALIGGGLTGAGLLATKGGREAASKATRKFWDRSKYQFTGHGIEGTAAERLTKARELGVVPELAAKPNAGQQLRDVANQKAFEQGWMTVPGTVHGMVTHPGQMLHNSWNRMDTLTKGLTGAAGVGIGLDALKPNEPGGPGRLERTLGDAAGTLGYTVGPAGLLPSALLGHWAGKAGAGVGRTIGNLVPNPGAQAVPETLASGGLS
jgi:hypothetical protein